MYMKLLPLSYLLIFSASIAAQSLQDSLKAYFPFSGNANDMSGNGNNGMITGAVFSDDAFGNAQSAILMDGVDDYVTIPHQKYLNYDQYQEFTISLWIRAAKKQLDVWPGQDRNVILSKWENNGPNNDNYPYNIRISNHNISSDEGKISSLRFSKVCNYNPLAVSASRVNDSLWHHVVMMRENGFLKLYIDCQLEASLAEADTCPMTNTHDIYLGRQGGILSPAYYRGSLDEVRIYNRALDGTEISSLCEEWEGLQSSDESREVSAYPNPANTEVNIEFDQALTQASALYVFDQYGHALNLEEVRGDHLIKLNTSQVRSGIYHFNLLDPSSGSSANGRFVVQR